MKNVVVYSSDTCPYCTAVKNFLGQNSVNFEEKNITTSVEARNELIQKGHRGVPVIVVDGEEVVGFDQARLTDLLGL